MTVFREWASGFCAAGVACALLSTLCPSGALRQAFGVLTALLMLCAMLSPVRTLADTLTDGLVVPSVTTEVSSAVSEASLEQAVSVIEDALYRDALSRLDGTDVTLKRVDAKRDMSRLDSIYIEKVRLVFDQTDHPVNAELVWELSMAWGIQAEVYYG